MKPKEPKFCHTVREDTHRERVYHVYDLVSKYLGAVRFTFGIPFKVPIKQGRKIDDPRH